MKSPSELMLQHEIMLLALRDKQGTFQSGRYAPALVGALLAQLVLLDRIGIKKDKGQVVILIDRKPTGDEVLDELLEKIASSKKQLRLEHWVGQGIAIKQLAQRIAAQLCDLKILRNEERRLLWVFVRQLYPEINSKYERRIKIRMSKLMFGQTTRHDLRTTVLVALANHTGLLASNFGKDRLQRNKQRIRKISRGDMFAARATKNAAAAMNSAILIAAIMPAVASQ